MKTIQVPDNVAHLSITFFKEEAISAEEAKALGDEMDTETSIINNATKATL